MHEAAIIISRSYRMAYTVSIRISVWSTYEILMTKSRMILNMCNLHNKVKSLFSIINYGNKVKENKIVSASESSVIRKSRCSGLIRQINKCSLFFFFLEYQTSFRCALICFLLTPNSTCLRENKFLDLKKIRRANTDKTVPSGFFLPYAVKFRFIDTFCTLILLIEYVCLICSICCFIFVQFLFLPFVHFFGS